MSMRMRLGDQAGKPPGSCAFFFSCSVCTSTAKYQSASVWRRSTNTGVSNLHLPRFALHFLRHSLGTYRATIKRNRDRTLFLVQAPRGLQPNTAPHPHI